MSIILGALGGLGEAGMQMAQNNQKAWADQDLMREKEQIAADRERALLNYKQQLTDAPLNRLTVKAKEYGEQTVPVAVPTSNTLTGAIEPYDGVGPQARTGFVGDIASVRKSLESLPEADRAKATAQLDRQIQAENDEARGIVGNAMRKRTPDEAMSEAVKDAKANDLSAYAAYQEKVGKSDREERRLDNQEGRQERMEITTNRRLDQQQEFQEARAKYQDKLLEIQDRRAKTQEDRASAAEEKADKRANQQALSSVLKDIGAQEDKIQVKLLDGMLTPEQKSLYEVQLKTLDRDRVNTRNELLKLSGIEPPATDASKDPLAQAIAEAAARKKAGTKPAAEKAAETPKPPVPSTIPGAPPRDSGETGFESQIVPAFQKAGINPGSPEYTDYLKRKIRLNQPLTPGEKKLAQSLNLQ